MSNYYDLKCLTCAEPAEREGDKIYAAYAGYDANRGHRELLAILILRPELEALGLAYKALKKNPEKLPAFVGWESGALINEPSRAAIFFSEHVGHLVVVASEYWEDAFFGCEKSLDLHNDLKRYHRELKPRENRNDCRLDHNHEGECSTTRPDGK